MSKRITVYELADALTAEDTDKTCPFCDKHGWGEDKHEPDCPFALAYRAGHQPRRDESFSEEELLSLLEVALMTMSDGNLFEWVAGQMDSNDEDLRALYVKLQAHMGKAGHAVQTPHP